MTNVTSFSDKFLIRAASLYAYDMSSYNLYQDPVFTTSLNIDQDFLRKYKIEIVKNAPFQRGELMINIRYLLIKDIEHDEYALIYQGSTGDFIEVFSGVENDWSNNFNSAVHLKHGYYEAAKAEFEYLKYTKNYNITAVSGNSLGGGYALNLAEDYPELRILALNPSPADVLRPYKESDHSLLLLTSSDILSRLLSCDLSRCNCDLDQALSLSSMERIELVYQHSISRVKRSVPYTSNFNVSIGHVGALRSYREIVEYYYEQNALYYNAKILANTHDKFSFSKILLKKKVQKLSRNDYLMYTDHYIFPNLMPYAQEVVSQYKLYPHLDEFLSYDIQTFRLLGEDELSVDQVTSLDNKKLIVDRIIHQFDQLQGSFNFYVKQNKSLLNSLNYKSAPGYSKRQFLENSLKFKIDWDWNMVRMIVGVPMNVKLKIGEIVEQNWSFISQLSQELNTVFQSLVSSNDINTTMYTQALKSALLRIELYYSDIVEQMSISAYNFEMMLISQSDKKLRENLFKNNIEIKDVSFDDLGPLSLSLMAQQIKDTEASIEHSLDFLYDNIDLFSDGLRQLVDELLIGLKKEEENVQSKKLYQQFLALRENIDFKSFFILLLHEFKDEFIQILLKGSIANEVLTNLLQMKESLEFHKRLLHNLKAHSKSYFTKVQDDYLCLGLNQCLTMINNLDKLIDILVN